MDPAADPRLKVISVRFKGRRLRCWRAPIDPSLIEFIAQARPAIFIERLPGGREIAFTSAGIRSQPPLSAVLSRWEERWERLIKPFRRALLLFCRRLPSRNIRLRCRQPAPPPPPCILRKQAGHRRRLAASV